MRDSWSLQQCNIVTSRFGNKQQVLRKRIMSVLGSRLCCTGTGKCVRKSDVADLWTGLLCSSLGTAMRSFRTISDGTGGEAGPPCIDLVQEHHVPERMKGMSLDTLASNTVTCFLSILVPYAYEVFLTKIFQSSIGHTLGSELRIFKISSMSSTDHVITTAILIHSAASLQVFKN